jgi:hypothetical protein
LQVIGQVEEMPNHISCIARLRSRFSFKDKENEDSKTRALSTLFLKENYQVLSLWKKLSQKENRGQNSTIKHT